MSTRTLYNSIRQPEYTGENRCVPCTVVNVAIAAVLSGLVALASIPVAIAAFLLCAGVIYVRGYLVPGTPTLTQEYFPDRVLRWFEKEPTEFGVRIETGDEVDVETVLQDVGVLEDRPEIGDLALTEAFRDEWYTEMDRLDEDEAQRVLGELLGIDVSRISVLPRSRSFEVKVDGDTSARWESSEALVVDMATERVLRDWVDNWTDLTVEHRSGITRGVRVYLDRCPRCEGTVTLDEETVKSCCRAHSVLASRCDDCGVRLFEIRASEVQQED